MTESHDHGATQRAPSGAPDEQRFDLIARGSQDGMWELDLATGDVYVSDRWCEIAGVTEAPSDMDGWVEVVHPQDRDLVREAAAAHVAGTTDHLEVEIRLTPADGVTRWIILRGLADGAETTRRLAGSITDTTAAHHAEVSLRHQALHDPLTGLPNRTFLMEDLNRHHAIERRNPGARIALLFLDLVGFKSINDHFGHDAGDEILRVVGRRLRFATRPEDLPARLGGDEFIVVMSGLSDDGAALQVAERIVAVLAKPIPVHDVDHQIVASAGLVMTTDDRWSPESLIREADTAMYRAKRRGSQQVEVQVLQHGARSREDTDDRSLATAADEGRLLVHYQPILVPEGLHVVGYEALLRWRRPGRGVVSAFRDGGLIQPNLERFLSRWALDRAIDEAVSARTSGIDIPMLAVNISRSHLVDAALAPSLEHKLATTGLAPEQLRLEIRSDTLDGLDVSVLEPLLRLGIRFHLDGFGVGDTSLRRMLDIAPLAVKIDPAITAAMLDDIDALRLVRSICAAANAADILVIAGGVELPAAVDAARQAGCTMVQGTYFNAPCSASSAFGGDRAVRIASGVSSELL